MKAPINKTLWGVVLLIVVGALMLVAQYAVQQMYATNAADQLINDSAYYISKSKQSADMIVTIITAIIMVLVGYFTIAKPWYQFYEDKTKIE